MTLYDVAPTILGAFDSHLSDYASKKFSRKGIQIKTRKYTRYLKWRANDAKYNNLQSALSIESKKTISLLKMKEKVWSSM